MNNKHKKLSPEELKAVVSKLDMENLDLQSLEVLSGVLNKLQAKRRHENPCSHTHPNGTLDISYVDGSPLVVCNNKNCRCKFSLQAKNDDQVKAIQLEFTSLIHQAIMMSDREDKDTLRRMHMLADECKWISETYMKLMAGGKKNKKNKKKQHDRVYGNYGIPSSYTGGIIKNTGRNYKNEKQRSGNGYYR